LSKPARKSKLNFHMRREPLSPPWRRL